MPFRAPVLLASVAFALAALAPLGAAAQSVSGEPLRLENAKREAIPAFRTTGAPAATLRFQPLPAARIEAMQRHNVAQGGKRVQIGIHRATASEAEALLPADMAWTPVNGGRVLRFDVTSPDAAAMRVALDLGGLPAGAELRVASRDGGNVEVVDAATLAAAARDGAPYWAPVTAGDTQRLELYVPGAAAFVPRIETVSHLVSSPFRPLDMAKSLGASGACNIDVACRTSSLGAPFVNVKNAVAMITFEIAGGTTSCTGTLLNDSTPSTQVPYFYSAAHCFTSQAVANTAITWWNFETPTCGARLAGDNVQGPRGSTVLFASLSTDVLFLRLAGAPPAGAFFAGWNASTLTAPTPVITVHHPRGDNKKYSRGTHSGFSSNVQFQGDPQVVTSAARASWLEGTTEGGSSGGGLFTLSGQDYQLRGGLYGGAAACANSGQSEANGNVDFYSRFDQVYPSLQQWLGTAAGPTRDYTGAWFFPSEPGWGLTVFNYPNTFFALFFVYDTAGRPAWYRMQSSWTGPDQITANLDRPTGPPWANSFNAGAITYARVGSATLTFTSATAGTLTINDGTVNRTVAISKL
jgi:hypothetical protein